MPNKKSQKGFTPLHPESPTFQNRDEWHIKIRSLRKPHLLGRGVTGFTLVEVIVASVLLALIAAGIFSITLSSQKLINRSQRRHFANEVAKAVLENLRSYLGDDIWDDQNNNPLHPSFAGGNGSWHNLNNSNDNLLNMYDLFGNTEFATKYSGKWCYWVDEPESDQSYAYRRAKVEVDWTEPTVP